MLLNPFKPKDFILNHDLPVTPLIIALMANRRFQDLLGREIVPLSIVQQLERRINDLEAICRMQGRLIRELELGQKR